MRLPLRLRDGLVLRLVTSDDAERLAAAYDRNREHLKAWEPTRPEDFFTEETQRAAIGARLSQYETGSCLPLVIANRQKIVGRMTLSGIVRGPFQSGSVGYWLDADYQGRGLATAALLGVVDLASGALSLHRLEAGTLVHNLASQRVLEHAGFEYFGTAPRYLEIAGSWQDHKLFQRILHD